MLDKKKKWAQIPIHVSHGLPQLIAQVRVHAKFCFSASSIGYSRL